MTGDLHPADHIHVHRLMTLTWSRDAAHEEVARQLDERAAGRVATGHPADAIQAKRYRDRAAKLRQSTTPPTMTLSRETP